MICFGQSRVHFSAERPLCACCSLVKQLVVEAFINFRFSQYVRVMGVYWLQKARYNRKKRTFERRKSKVIHPIECKQAPPLPPKLHPMPRGCRAAELKVIMQQGVLETSIMEEEGDWDLSEKRVVPEG